MASKNFDSVFQKILKAGKSRNYTQAIALLEDLLVHGEAERHPEILLYLGRSYHSLLDYTKAIGSFRTYISLCPEDGAGWFFLGRSLFYSTEYEQAVFALKKSLEISPESIDARVFLGFSFLKARRVQAAREIFESTLYDAPDDPRLNQGYLNSLFIEAVRNYRKGEAELARQMLTFLINNDIDGVIPRLYLAHSLRDLGYAEEAFGQYQDALSFSPDDPALKWYPISILMEQGQIQEAIALMDEYGLETASHEPSAPLIAFEIIKNHLDQEKWQEAVDACRNFIKAHGDNAQVQALMGEGFRNLHDSRLALVHFNRALQLDAKDPSPHYGILLVQLAEQNWREVLATITKAVKAGCDPQSLSLYSVIARSYLNEDPESLLPEIQAEIHKSGAIPELMLVLAHTYFKLGLFDLSLGWYQKGIEVNPDDEYSWLGYIACCEQLIEEPQIDQEDFDFYIQELEKSYDGYIKRWNDNSAIVKDGIKFFVDSKKWTKAADYTELLLAREPSVQLERNLALFNRKAGNYRQAAILYRKQLRAHPKDRNLLVNLVFCLDQMNETALASELITKANKAFSPNLDFLLIEGRLLNKLNKTEEALELFRKAIDAFPNDERSWDEIAHAYEKRGVHELAANYKQKADTIRRSNLKKK